MLRLLAAFQALAPITDYTFWPHCDARGEDLSTPPIIWWTYRQLPEPFAEFLQRLIAEYQGSVEWRVWTTGQRWILMPARVRAYMESHGCNGDLSAAAELRTAEPDFGKRANAELPRLAEYIWNHLADKNGEKQK